MAKRKKKVNLLKRIYKIMSEFRTIYPKDIPTGQLHGMLLGCIAPRPIAFASTIDLEGNVNLSPFSFFNIFGSNPPILIFSPSSRVRDNTPKHSLGNVREVGEVSINIVNYPMVEQVSLASTEYDKGVNEFIKAGFTEEPSLLIKPPRVKESPASFECKVNQIIETGTGGGAGNLIICEILVAYFREDIFNEQGQVDPNQIDLVSRMGGDWYCRASGNAVFSVAKPNANKGIGFDNLPEKIKSSYILSGNNLARLANIEKFPAQEQVIAFRDNPEILAILNDFEKDTKNLELNLHQIAKKYLEAGDLEKAWLVLLQSV